MLNMKHMFFVSQTHSHHRQTLFIHSLQHMFVYVCIQIKRRWGVVNDKNGLGPAFSDLFPSLTEVYANHVKCGLFDSKQE
jgi:hypothetical protein